MILDTLPVSIWRRTALVSSSASSALMVRGPASDRADLIAHLQKATK
jgi:hypothetical protein